MGKTFDAIPTDMTTWIAHQRMFFVATAPLAADGLVNCSPKGMDTFRIVSPTEVAYLDLTGSGVETISHLQENARIVFMFCAFDGPPKIVRLYGRGEVVTPDAPAFGALRALFPDFTGARAVIRVPLHRISDSCGYSVPRLSYVEDRDVLRKYADAKGEQDLQRYRNENNAKSLDGLPGLKPST